MTLFNIFGPILLIALLINCLIFMRSERVYHARDDYRRAYGDRAMQRLPSYRHMMLRFWVWDIREFLTREGTR